MKRMKTLRESMGLSQQQLAKALNVSQAAVSKYEMGGYEPDNEMIKRISEFFCVSTDYLLEMTDEKTNISYSGLSADEKALLFDFKRLDKIGKAKAMAYLQGLVDAENRDQVQ